MNGKSLAVLVLVFFVLFLMSVVLVLTADGAPSGSQVVCTEHLYLPVVGEEFGENITPQPTATVDPLASSTPPPAYYCVTPTAPPTSTIPPAPTK